MAEVADFHIPSLDGFEEEDEVEALGSIAYWPYEFENEEIYSSESDLDADPFSPRFADYIASAHLDEEEHKDCCIDCFGSDSDSAADLHDFLRQDHEVNLVSPTPIVENEDPLNEDPFFRVADENNEMGSNYLDLGLGLGLGLGRIDEEQDDENGGFMVDDDDMCSEEFYVGRRCESVESSDVQREGLRAVGIGSDSDEEVDERILGLDHGSLDDEVQDDLGIPLCWDGLRLDDTRETNDFYDWEDVGNRVEDRDVLNMMMEYEVRSISATIEVQEVAEGTEETLRNLDWQVLLGRNPELEHDFDNEDYLYPVEYETIIGQLAETENDIHGSPPTTKSVIDNLPSIVLTQEDIKNKGALCAVCKDEISMEEQAKLLPCSHYYHGDCILPWLNIRNSCPVCRFELPTDDPEYEQRRAQRASAESQVSYDFQMLPED